MRPPLILLGVGLVACGGSEPKDDKEPDRNTVDTLEIPDLTGIDFDASFKEALTLASTVVGSQPWDAHLSLLAERDGCPDVYAGIPDGDIDELDSDMGASSWMDFCETGVAGHTWSGWAWWEADGTHVIEPLAPEIGLQTGSRTLIADATINTPDGALWEFDGQVSESVDYTIIGPSTDWTWSSLIEGTFTGSRAFEGTATPSGWRTDLYVGAAKGEGDFVEMRGNVYLFDGRLQGRFDSMVMDLEFLGANNIGEGGGAQEPLGWIGLRDENAVWYDLVFLPRTAGDATAPPFENELSIDDGCGTLYVRGVEIDKLCIDLGFVLDGLIEPPEIESFVLPHRGLP